jgi:hypothetical protein
LLYHALPIFTLSENTYVKSSFVSLKQERVERKHGESIQTTSIRMHMITNDDDDDDDDDDDLKKYRKFYSNHIKWKGNDDEMI